MFGTHEVGGQMSGEEWLAGGGGGGGGTLGALSPDNQVGWQTGSVSSAGDSEPNSPVEESAVYKLDVKQTRPTFIPMLDLGDLDCFDVRIRGASFVRTLAHSYIRTFAQRHEGTKAHLHTRTHTYTHTNRPVYPQVSHTIHDLYAPRPLFLSHVLLPPLTAARSYLRIHRCETRRKRSNMPTIRWHPTFTSQRLICR